MQFYISWYPGDPWYPLYDDDCSLLISITSVSQQWRLDHCSPLPQRVLIDSGGFRYAVAPKEARTPLQILKQQLALLADTTIPTIVCARDKPLLGVVSSNERDDCIVQTIAFAYELKNLWEQGKLPPHITPMAVIQGYDGDSLAYCARELCHLDFPLYGLGSLASLKRHFPLMERIGVVAPIVGASKLHILGVSVVSVVRQCHRLGIHSVDSTRPAKAAAYNELLYSQPFRRFGVVGISASGSPKLGRLPESRRLAAPLPCPCPACQEIPSQVLQVGQRAGIRSRTLHNYYHLKRAFFEDDP